MRLAPPAVLALALALPAAANAADCTVNALKSLQSCVAEVRLGGVIEIEDGAYAVPTIALDRSVTIRAKRPGNVSIAHDKLVLFGADALWESVGGLVEDDVIFKVGATAGDVVIEGVSLRPTRALLQGLGDARVRGRGVVVDGARVTLRDVVLEPWTDSSATVGSRITVLDRRTDSSVDPLPGGLLALVRSGGTLRVERGRVRAIRAPGLIGSAILAVGARTEVVIVDAATFELSESAAGMVAVRSGAKLVIGRTDAGPQPTFRSASAELGGAVAAVGGDVVILGGAFHDNGVPRASGFGRETCGGDVGVIERGTVTVEAGAFRSSQATFGGSICAVASDVTIRGGAFDDAQARQGAFVYAAGDRLRPVPLLLSGATFHGGHVALNDGEIAFNATAGPATRLRPGGGAISAVFVDASLDRVRVERSGGDRDDTEGGAIRLAESSASLSGVDLSDNNAVHGAGVWSALGDLEIADGSAVGNRAQDRGGAILKVGGDLRVSGAVFQRNEASVGGAIAALTPGLVSVDGAAFSQNVAGSGGAIAVLAREATVRGSTFSDNRAVDGAGADLFATVGRVAALDVDVRGAVAISASTFSGGRAAVGGAIAIEGPQASIAGSEFSDAAASAAGGAIAVVDSPAFTLQRSRISGAEAPAGGAVYAAGTDVVLVEDGEIGGNSASVGGGLWVAGARDLRVTRALLCDNRGLVGSALHVQDVPAAGVARVASSVLHGGARGSVSLLDASASAVEISQSALIGGVGGGVVARGGRVDVDASLLGWVGVDGERAPLLAGVEGGAIGISRSAVWLPQGQPALFLDGQPAALPPDTILSEPHLRGALRGGSGVPACDLDALHPRPTSDTLLDGWPAREGDRVLGVFGGEHRFVDDWRTDADGDGSPRIFDCDDADAGVLERRVQFVDADGDGVGGAPWDGDDCDLLPGHVSVGGDCDDDDPTVAAICGRTVGYYGARCASAAGASPAFALVLGGLLFARRRRTG